MLDFFLYLFGIVALLGALGVVLGRHPITAAMNLVLTLLAVGTLYGLLEAHLLMAVQIIVYVGAVMVLIVYTIQLLDLRDDDFRAGVRYNRIVGMLLGIGWVGLLWNRFDQLAPSEPATLPEGFGGVRAVMLRLLGDHLLTFELVGVLLLVAIVAAYILAVRSDRSRLPEGGSR